MGYIYFEDGIVSLDGKEIHGLLQSLKVDGKVRFDETKVDGVSGKKKTPAGYEDSTVNMTFLLLTEENSTCYDKLDELNAVFKDIDNNANPKIYTVANRHLLARNVRELVFSSLNSQEDSSSDEISVTLKFLEHNPPIIKVEEQVAKSPTLKELQEETILEQATDAADEFIIKVDE